MMHPNLICDCCGQYFPDPHCEECGRPHSPKTSDGCEQCDPGLVGYEISELERERHRKSISDAEE